MVPKHRLCIYVQDSASQDGAVSMYPSDHESVSQRTELH